MKKIRNSLPVFFVIFTLLFLSRCTIADDIQQLKNAVDSLQIIVGTPEFNTLVHLEFVDAKSKAYLADKSVIVSVSGKDAAMVFNNIGEKKSQYEAKLGILDLILDPSQIDTVKIKTTPVEFDVTIKAAGFSDVTKKIYFNNTKRQTINIPMINLTDAPAGVKVDSKINFVATGADGKTTQKATITLDAGKQLVEIPAGVVLKDKDGNKITGPVSSQIIFFDPLSPAAQEAIPGGLAVQAVLPGGATGDVEFVSAGMYFVTLKAGDKEVKTFEGGGIRLRTVVAPSLINPNTGVPVKANDVIEMWSIEEGTGKWIYEKTDTIRSVNGELVLEETVKHLSGWNWDFHFQSCSNGPKFVFSGITNKFYVNLSTNFSTIYGNSSTSYIDPTGTSLYSYYNNFIQLYNTPRNRPAKFTFANSPYNVGLNLSFSPSSIDISNMCDGKTYNIVVTNNTVTKEIVTVNLDLSASSSTNTTLVIKPNLPFYFALKNTSWIPATLKNGKASFQVELNKDYDLAFLLGNTSGKGNLKVGSQGTNFVVTFTPQISFSSTATSNPISFTVPKTSTNSVDIKYTAIVSDEILNLFK